MDGFCILSLPQVDIPADAAELEIGAAAVHLAPDSAAADALHFLTILGQLEIRIHVAGYGTHFQVDSRFGR